METPDKKWIYRRVDWSQTYAYYPSLGVWPKKHWWRTERDKDKRTMKARTKHAISNVPEGARPGPSRSWMLWTAGASSAGTPSSRCSR